jgi:hypothetical protein
MAPSIVLGKTIAKFIGLFLNSIKGQTKSSQLITFRRVFYLERKCSRSPEYAESYHAVIEKWADQKVGANILDQLYEQAMDRLSRSLRVVLMIMEQSRTRELASGV